MELQALYHFIDLQPEIIQKLAIISAKINLDQLDFYLTELMNMETSANAYQYLNTYFDDDNDHLNMLYCQLECARRVSVKYREKHIPDIIFLDTMKCFKRFITECGEKNGRLFFDRGFWTYRQISMRLFRIGTLEYEFMEHEGEKVIEIHIPSDANLSKALIDDSLQQAALFFQTYYRNYEYKKYTCNSWLLSPALKSLLSEKSNIYSFAHRFEIIREDKEDREYMEWLFQVPSDEDYESLPETTGLQKRAKKLLLEGGKIGSGYGIIKRF